jgi:hypothetical protein
LKNDLWDDDLHRQSTQPNWIVLKEKNLSWRVHNSSKKRRILGNHLHSRHRTHISFKTNIINISINYCLIFTSKSSKGWSKQYLLNDFARLLSTTVWNNV